MGVADDDKGVWVDLLHRPLHGDDLCPGAGAQDHLLVLAAVSALALQKCHTTIQLQQAVGQLLMQSLMI